MSGPDEPHILPEIAEATIWDIADGLGDAVVDETIHSWSMTYDFNPIEEILRLDVKMRLSPLLQTFEVTLTKANEDDQKKRHPSWRPEGYDE